jgi:hypothetical protein
VKEMALRIKNPLVICVLAMVGSAFLFQNCTGGIRFTGQSLGVKPQGGAGSDGMIVRYFHSLKTCSDGNVGVGSSIEIKEFTDRKEVYLNRDDCQDLESAVKLQLSDLEFVLNDSSMFVYKNEIFDLRTGVSQQRVTTNFCRGSSALSAVSAVPGAPVVQTSASEKVSALTWIENVNPHTIYGRVDLEDLSTTGTLEIKPESSLSGVRFTSILTSVPTSVNTTVTQTVTPLDASAFIRLDIESPPNFSLVEFRIDGVSSPLRKATDLHCVNQVLPPELLTYSWIKTGFGVCSLAEQPLIFSCMDNTGKVVSQEKCGTLAPVEILTCPLKVVRFAFHPASFNTTWTVPPGVTRIRGYVIGGGGGGSGLWGGGSGGESIATMPVGGDDQVAYITVGGGGTNSMTEPISAGQSKIRFNGMIIQGFGGENASLTNVGQSGTAYSNGMPSSVNKSGNSGIGPKGGGAVDHHYPHYGTGGSGSLPGAHGQVIIVY